MKPPKIEKLVLVCYEYNVCVCLCVQFNVYVFVCVCMCVYVCVCVCVYYIGRRNTPPNDVVIGGRRAVEAPVGVLERLPVFRAQVLHL